MIRGLASVVVGSACWLAETTPLSAEEADTTQPPPEVSTEYFVEQHGGWTVAYHPAARERVREVLPALARVRSELTERLGIEVLGDIELRIAALPFEVTRLSPSGASALTSHGGHAFPSHKLVVVSLAGAEQDGDDLESALRHHLAHLAVVEATKGATVPTWFGEGFAVHFAGSRSWGRFTDLEIATLTGDPPSLVELREPAPTGDASASVPHDKPGRPDAERSEALAADFVRFASNERAMPALVDGLRQGLAFDVALENAFGVDAAAIDRAWRRDTTRRYGVFPIMIFAFVVVGLALLTRYLRRRAAAKKAQSGGRSIHRGRRLSARRREVQLMPLHLRNELRVPTHIAEHDVPQVEHDGRWHTLH